jgi:hypothetical protein
VDCTLIMHGKFENQLNSWLCNLTDFISQEL